MSSHSNQHQRHVPGTSQHVPGMSQHVPGMSRQQGMLSGRPATNTGVVENVEDEEDVEEGGKERRPRPVILEKDFNSETLKIKADTLFAFLNSTILFEKIIDPKTRKEIEEKPILPPLYSLSTRDLDTIIYNPIRKELDTLVEMYKNGDVGMKDIKDAFKYSGMEIDEEDEDQFIVDRTCDDDFLMVDKTETHVLLDDYDDDDSTEDSEEDGSEEDVGVEVEVEEEIVLVEEDVSMFAIKDDLSHLIHQAQRELKEFYITSTNDKTNHNSLPMTPEILSKLQSTVIDKL